MIGYITIGTNDLPRAAAFYDTLFAEIGAGRLRESDRSIAWGTRADAPALGVCKPFDLQPATAGNGTMIALKMDAKAQVDALLLRHQVAHAAYLGRLDAVRAVAARAAGSAPGSEAWVNAHVVLSRLDKIRDDSVAAVRAFDGLIADASAGDSGLVALLTDAQKPVLDDVAAQNDEIGRLSRLIGE